METAEIARKALEILDRDGWNKGYLTYPYTWEGERWALGSHCIGGAWNLALHGTVGWWGGFEHDTYTQLADVIVAQHPEWADRRWGDIDLIASWNNDEATTLDDVRVILEKLAAG